MSSRPNLSAPKWPRRNGGAKLAASERSIPLFFLLLLHRGIKVREMPLIRWNVSLNFAVASTEMQQIPLYLGVNQIRLGGGAPTKGASQ